MLPLRMGGIRRESDLAAPTPCVNSHPLAFGKTISDPAYARGYPFRTGGIRRESDLAAPTPCVISRPLAFGKTTSDPAYARCYPSVWVASDVSRI